MEVDLLLMPLKDHLWQGTEDYAKKHFVVEVRDELIDTLEIHINGRHMVIKLVKESIDNFCEAR
jgi:hypothetical protein